MSRSRIIAASLTLALTSACSWSGSDEKKEDSKVTETRMDDIDKIEGTISDEMIDTTQSTEQAPLAGKEGEGNSDGAEVSDSAEDAAESDEEKSE